MGIVVSDFQGDLGGSHLRSLQQFLRLADSQAGQVLGEGQPGLLCENRGKMALTQMDLSGYVLQHQIGIGIVLAQIGPRLADRRIAVSGPVSVPEGDRLPQQIRQAAEAFLPFRVQRLLHLRVVQHIPGFPSPS